MKTLKVGDDEYVLLDWGHAYRLRKDVSFDAWYGLHQVVRRRELEKVDFDLAWRLWRIRKRRIKIWTALSFAGFFILTWGGGEDRSWAGFWFPILCVAAVHLLFAWVYE